MTLATMANNVLRFTPGLNLDIVKSLIQDSYIQLCAKDWNCLKFQSQIYTSPVYATGTVAITEGGTVTGVGTTFTPAMVGQYMKVYYSDSFFEIESYTNATTIKLKNWSGEIVAAGQTFSIFKTIYTVDPSFKLVWDVVYQTSLRKRSQSYFNKIDPGRTSTSSSPIAWALAGINSNGVIQIEIYPPVTAVIALRVYGKIGGRTLANDETSKIPESLIEDSALLSCYRLKEIKEPNQGWEAKIMLQAETYKESLADFTEEDFQLGDHSDRVKDTTGEFGYPMDDNFALSHDVE